MSTTIQPGETETVISRETLAYLREEGTLGETPFSVKPVGGRIRLGTGRVGSARQSSDVVPPDNPKKVTPFSVESVKGYNPTDEPVTVRVTKLNFLSELLGWETDAQPTEGPAELAGNRGYDSSGQLDTHINDSTIPANSDKVLGVITTSESEGQRVVETSMHLTGLSSNNYDPGISGRFTIEDSDGNPKRQPVAHIGGFPLDFPDRPRVPEGGSAVLRVLNPTANSIDIRYTTTLILP